MQIVLVQIRYFTLNLINPANSGYLFIKINTLIVLYIELLLFFNCRREKHDSLGFVEWSSGAMAHLWFNSIRFDNNIFLIDRNSKIFDLHIYKF